MTDQTDSGTDSVRILLNGKTARIVLLAVFTGLGGNFIATVWNGSGLSASLSDLNVKNEKRVGVLEDGLTEMRGQVAETNRELSKMVATNASMIQQNTLRAQQLSSELREQSEQTKATLRAVESISGNLNAHMKASQRPPSEH